MKCNIYTFDIYFYSYAFAPLGDEDDEMDGFLADDDEEDSEVEEFDMEKTKIKLGKSQNIDDTTLYVVFFTPRMFYKSSLFAHQ